MSIAEELARIAGKVGEVDRTNLGFPHVGRGSRTQTKGRLAIKAAAKAAQRLAVEQAAAFGTLEDRTLMFVEAVTTVTGLSQQAIWHRTRRGTFPPPAGKQRTGTAPRLVWRVGDVRRWLEANRP